MVASQQGRQIGGFEMEASFSGFGYYPGVPPPEMLALL
jgi:hypothetical protein